MKVEEVYLVNKSWRCFGSNVSAQWCTLVLYWTRHSIKCNLGGAPMVVGQHCLWLSEGGRGGWEVIRQEIAGIDSGLRSRGGVSACKTYPIRHSNALHQSSHLHEIEKRKRNEYEWAGHWSAFHHFLSRSSCSERSSVYLVESRLRPHALILSSTDFSIFLHLLVTVIGQNKKHMGKNTDSMCVPRYV